MQNGDYLLIDTACEVNEKSKDRTEIPEEVTIWHFNFDTIAVIQWGTLSYSDFPS